MLSADQIAKIIDIFLDNISINKYKSQNTPGIINQRSVNHQFFYPNLEMFFTRINEDVGVKTTPYQWNIHTAVYTSTVTGDVAGQQGVVQCRKVNLKLAF